MNKKALVILATVSAVLTLVAIPSLDRSLAEMVHHTGLAGNRLFSFGTRALDLASGKELSKFLPGLVLIGAGLAFLALARLRLRASALLFIGLVQLLSTLLSGVSKNLFGRLRPFELLTSGAWEHAWFAGGSSFPSGHTGFYFGLFLPLAYLFPRWRWPLLVVPFFVAVARIAVNDHFLSDVTASMALAAFITWLAASVRELWAQPRPDRLVKSLEGPIQ